ncbi:MAG: thiosulfate oxidation carrier complex protein SoxZ [Salinisphaeraceae bacterium]|nr:thiosulfate oxidation carrier complex protein SoxZ [Salinisphaeraceae bacterium]
MAGRMRMRARMSGDVAEVKVLMQHPMETGQRKDSEGKPIPAHYIKEVMATLGDRTVMAAQWGAAISQNPYLSFRIKDAKKGDTVKVSWTDNKGETASTEAKIG